MGASLLNSGSCHNYKLKKNGSQNRDCLSAFFIGRGGGGSVLICDFGLYKLSPAPEPFKIIQRCLTSQQKKKTRLEPTKSLINKKQNAQVLPARLAWLTLVNQVKTNIINSKEYVYIPDLSAQGRI